MLLSFALVFNATSCELLSRVGIDLEIIIDIEGIIGSKPNDGDVNTTPDTEGDNNQDQDNSTDNTPTPTPDPTPEPKPELVPSEGGIIYLPNEPDPITSDPYVNVNKTEFYANYTPAISYMDSYYRTKHNLMSGSIDPQEAAPTVSSYQPEIDGMLVANNTYIFSEDGNTYYVIDAHGEIVNKIYKGGAYVTLEEVAAYVFAFGEIPANHSESKKTKPTSSPWGIYLRVNHTMFSGDTSRYPYEPELPNISGCGGDLYYYEMDIGTTGTDTGNGYEVAPYNNGTKITRGAARIVHARYDLDRDGVIEIGENYVFYTYNHYNDFQEYLNYEGGWGEMFGNVTGGGTLSSKYNYNPTPYVEVIYASLVNKDNVTSNVSETVVLLWLPRRGEV